MPDWALAFVAALLVTSIATPRLRRLAIATDFVDTPGQHKSHSAPIPYLGGVGLIGGTLVGLLFESGLPARAGAIVFSAAALGSVGLIDDDRTVVPAYRFLAEIAAAVVAVALGLRIHATGVEAMDMALTVVWVVGVTNALNLLDNMDGLAGGIAATAGVAVLALALFGQQPLVAGAAAALVGACVAFLRYNRPPASIFMGDAGSLFLGFVLAVLTVDVSPDVTPPLSFVIPLVLMALPVLDTTTVTLSRLRRGRNVFIGGRDHLSHRLVARGLSNRAAVGVLVAAQALLGAVAVLGGRRVLPIGWAVVAALAVLAVVVAVTAPVRVYEEDVVGFPRRAKFALVAVAAALPLMAVPAAIALVRARAPARAAADSATLALAALRSGDTDRTAAAFREAEASFAVAKERLDGPLTSLGLAVPGLSSNLHAARTLVSMGHRLSQTGAEISSVSDAKQLRVASGGVPLDRLERLTPLLVRAAAVLRQSEERLAGVDRAFLVPEVRDAVADLQTRLTRESNTAERAADSARLLPAMLGAEGPRRYFVAFQNNSELRGSGGLIGNWAEMEADNGRLRLTRFGRLEELIFAGRPNRVVDMPREFLQRWGAFDVAGQWQQVNVSPDFPSTGKVIASAYPQSGGAPVDGVISVDPPGLAAMLELTGAVTVPGWHEPIGAHNVVDVTLRAAYERFPIQEERIAFLGEVARRTSEAFTSADVGNPPAIATALGRAARGRHLQVYMTRPEEQALMNRLGADGAVPPVRGDSLFVVNQNLAANKVDLYLRRRVNYDVELDPRGDVTEVRGRLEVVMENQAPSSGLPSGVIGPYDDRFVAGENRTYVSVYTPFALQSATLDGEVVRPETHDEHGHRSQSMVVSIPSRQTRTFVVDVRGRVQLTDDGWYRLDLFHQPVIVPEDVEVTVRVPDGWEVADTRAARATSDRVATASIRLDQSQTLWIRVQPTGWTLVRDRLFDG